MSYLREILPGMLRYPLARAGLARPGTPINLTFSVTNVCQSRCKTCQIWQLYRIEPDKRRQELTTAEIEAIFRSMGHVYVFNISGGEPFLRPDLLEIISLACRHLTPGIVHIPTNAIAADLVQRRATQIVEFLHTQHPGVHFTLKPSLDHIGPRHDEIRGVPGNFDKVMRVFHALKPLEARYPQFHLELGTVISAWNVADIAEIARFVTSLGVGSYRNEIAERRAEMFNQTDPITPAAQDYERAIAFFVREIRASMKDRPTFQRITNAFRLIYYDLAIQVMRQNRQVIPCYGGISNAHLTPYGDIWACCTLGYDKPMGNLRDFSYDFSALWSGPQARAVRAHIRAGQCACPLANQMYSNILMHPPSLLRVLREISR